MAKKLKGTLMLVGNRLDDGRAVFFNAETGWVADATGATLAQGPALEALIETAKTDIARNFIAGFEAVEAEQGRDGVRPLHGRPLMQSQGPSVRLDLGYQTGLEWESA